MGQWRAVIPVTHSSSVTSPPHTPHTKHITMAIPDSVKAKVGEMPDVSSMSKEDLAALVKQMYDQSCAVFGEKFDMEYQVKKMDMEIHNLEMETSESHGTFKIPKLKKATSTMKGAGKYIAM